jgi:hypothetical protein
MNGKSKEEKKEVNIMNEVNRVPMTQESRARMTLNIYDLQYLIRLQDLSNDAFREELKKLYEEDNDTMCKNIAEIVEAQNKILFKAIENQTNVIEVVAKDISIIKKDIINIKDRLEIIEDSVEKDENEIKLIKNRCDERLERIEIIEKDLGRLNLKFIEELIKDMEEARPKLLKLLKYSSPLSTSIRIFGAMILGWIMTWLLMKYAWHLI